jgi:uncharacterized membrane-anchored protein YjiN (DUF445 family)
LLLKIQHLENQPTKVVEVIKEVPVEKVVIQEKIVEVPIEVIKEIVIEKDNSTDKSKIEALQNTIGKLREDNIEKEKKITKLEQTIKEIQSIQNKQAVYLRGSNLDDKLYK